MQNSDFKRDQLSEDIDALFVDVDNDGDNDLYVVSGGNDFDENDKYLQDRLYINDGKGNFVRDSKTLPIMNISGGCISEGDYDNDGDIDLFVGGRQIPGRYPFPAQSFLLENNDGIFTNILEEENRFNGMVSDASWIDINNDDWLDLVLVGEWMPVKIFMNNEGLLDDPIVIENSEGWWNCIEFVDINNDGWKDIALGNLGLNYKYKASPDEPFEIFCSDFDENGSLDIVLSYYNSGNRFPLRGRECTSNQMPFIKEKFPDYHSFAMATIDDVYEKENLSNSLTYSAKNFANSILINKEGKEFSLQALPNEAQISSINDFLVIDINLDGYSDLIAAGNLYGSEVETPRNDASFGFVLLNDGQGNLVPLSNQDSGLYLDGQISQLLEMVLESGDRKLLAACNNNVLQFFDIQIK